MARKDHDAVREDLANHLARLWRYGVVLSGRGDVAEDLVQATCVRALEKSHQFEPGTRLDRWLFTILHSIWLNELRAQRARARSNMENHNAETFHDGIRAVETTIRARQVLRQVQELPHSQRATIFLVCVEGFAYREAAEILGVPVGTIMSRISSARLSLARMAEDPTQASSSKAET